MPLWRSRLIVRLAAGAPVPEAAARRRTIPRRRYLPVGARIAGAILLLGVLVALLAPILEPRPPTALHVGPLLHPPSARFPLGTDQLGRDVLSRLLAGARLSLTIGVLSVALALMLAAVVGSVAAVGRRWISETIMRILDVVMAFPGVIIAVCFIAVVQPGLLTTIGVISFLYTPPLSRVVRAAVLAQYGESYVDAARSVGASRSRILLHHVAINCAGPILVLAATMVADAILLESSLSFLGLGIRPPAPSWGNVLSDGRAELFAGAWWICLFPGVAIFVCVLVLNVLAEGFADALAAPRRVLDSDADAPSSAAVRAAPVTPTAGAATTGGPALAASPATRSLLRVDRLSVSFPEVYGQVPVVSCVSFEVGKGEVVAVVGESGCGKSLIGTALMGLLPPIARVTGSATLEGRELTGIPAGTRRRHLGIRMAMIYQDALSALNPGMSVGRQLGQVCGRDANRTPAELFDMVGLSPRTLRSYPHQLSGGQRQRALIAMALAGSPQVLIADEPTTALDETVQAQVVDLLLSLRDEIGLSILLVTHDLALAASSAERTLVMYAGQLVETGPTRAITRAPRHPYTAGLLSAISSLEELAPRLRPIAGTVPSPTQFPSGCRFIDRCPRTQPICAQNTPPLRAGAGRRHVACWFPLGGVPAPADTLTAAATE